MPLEYVGIRVTDLARSLAFYSGLLGLRELRRGTMSHGGVFVLLEDPSTHQRLELNWYPKGHKYDTPYVPGEGLDHIGFEVQDARATYDRLVSMGYEPAVEPWVEDGFLLCFVKDPDGNWVELYSPIRDG
jgi:lactoylglutathione lyase